MRRSCKITIVSEKCGSTELLHHLVHFGVSQLLPTASLASKTAKIVQGSHQVQKKGLGETPDGQRGPNMAPVWLANGGPQKPRGSHGGFEHGIMVSKLPHDPKWASKRNENGFTSDPNLVSLLCPAFALCYVFRATWLPQFQNDTVFHGLRFFFAPQCISV